MKRSKQNIERNTSANNLRIRHVANYAFAQTSPITVRVSRLLLEFYSGSSTALRPKEEFSLHIEEGRLISVQEATRLLMLINPTNS